MAGGAGDDTYFVNTSGDSVREVTGAGTDTVFSLVSYALAADVERLVLNGSSSSFGTGNDLANDITGNAGDNNIDGSGGGDLLRGGAGADRLIGGTGRDVIYGGTDSDSDIFLFRSTAESTPGAARDLLHDFTNGIDKIDLHLIDADTTLVGNQAFAFSASGPAAHSVWVVDVGAHLIVRADVNGDKIGELEFQLIDVNLLLPGDLVL